MRSKDRRAPSTGARSWRPEGDADVRRVHDDDDWLTNGRVAWRLARPLVRSQTRNEQLHRVAETALADAEAVKQVRGRAVLRYGTGGRAG